MTAAFLASSLVTGAIRAGDVRVLEFPANSSSLPRLADVPAALAKVLPSVVGIRTELASGMMPNCTDQGEAGGVSVDEGSGVVVSAGGEVLTNNHVVAGAVAITVTVAGHAGSYPADLVGADPADDLALLQVVGGPKMTPIVPAPPEGTAVGEGVLAVGNALGLSQSSPTVTEGIISAEGRTLTAAVSCTKETLDDLLQTDAALNPGDSGGPLVDAAGRVVGIDTAVASGSRGQPTAQDVGFAIPVSGALALLAGLRRGGTIGAPATFLGVRAESMTPSLRREFDYTAGYGALVDSVLPGSPAAAAGLQPGDVIVSVDGRPVTSAAALHRDVAAARPGESVEVGYYRRALLRRIVVMLTTTPSPA
jgi:S1-C subfamily serine protease